MEKSNVMFDTVQEYLSGENNNEESNGEERIDFPKEVVEKIRNMNIDFSNEEISRFILRTMINDHEFLERYGPINPTLTHENELKICQNSPTGKCCYARCCCHYPYEDNDVYGENYEIDWFVGKCDMCNEDIQERFLARRITCRYGGFRGCFCRNECAFEYCRLTEFDEETLSIEISFMTIVCEIMNEFPMISLQYFDNYQYRLDESLKMRQNRELSRTKIIRYTRKRNSSFSEYDECDITYEIHLTQPYVEKSDDELESEDEVPDIKERESLDSITEFY